MKCLTSLRCFCCHNRIVRLWPAAAVQLVDDQCLL